MVQLVWAEIRDGQPVRIFKNRKLACQSGADIQEMERAAATGAIRHAVIVRDNSTCTHCGMTVNESLPWYMPNSAHMHERESRGRGGEISLDNSVTLCKACHLDDPIAGHGRRKVQWSVNQKGTS